MTYKNANSEYCEKTISAASVDSNSALMKIRVLNNKNKQRYVSGNLTEVEG